MPDVLTLATRALRLLPPEVAHSASLGLAPIAGRLMRRARSDDPRLCVGALGLNFSNPLGLAPGYDKDARVFHVMTRLGFGFVEVGTLTPLAQKGNPRPRIFRLTRDRAVINRLGFNNSGIERAAARLERHRGNAIIGINIGANRDSIDRVADYVRGFERLAGYASYVAINVSSPNTPGLRDLQKRNELLRLLGALAAARASKAPSVPLFVKISPDLSAPELDGVADAVLDSGIEGVIVSNTTTARPASLSSGHARESGGLSGIPLFRASTNMLKEMRRRLGSRAVLVGVGGIASGSDAYAKIRAGASLVQLYTALSYEGPGLIARIKAELLACLERDGFANVQDAIGSDVT